MNHPASSANDLWIFGYGSLMWRPGFEFEEAVPARLRGYRRCFCVYSTNHRGTGRRPGLVLGLDRGGVCDGVAFRVAAAHAKATSTYLRAREQVHGVYRETFVPVTLHEEKRREVLAQAYIVERAHPSYTGTLALRVQAHLIRGARGLSGANLDYLVNTLSRLRSLEIDEPEMRHLMTLIGPHFARGAGDEHSGPRPAALLAICRRLPFDAPLLHLSERRRFVFRRQLAVWSSANPTR